jgi:hypothetical protein
MGGATLLAEKPPRPPLTDPNDEIDPPLIVEYLLAPPGYPLVWMPRSLCSPDTSEVCEALLLVYGEAGPKPRFVMPVWMPLDTTLLLRDSS